MIYDCFTFFNELDLLDIRLNYLDKYVDKFVIVESTVTFSGKEKRLFFEENKHLFEKFKDKIIHVIVDDTPEDFTSLNENTGDALQDKINQYVNRSPGWQRQHEKQWGREIFQREAIFRGIKNCEDNDIIILSDLDEIPNAEVIEKLDFTNSTCFELKQRLFYYNINLLRENNWSGTKISKWNFVKDSTINEIRQNKITDNTIPNGGWHLSFMGGKDRIIEKIEAYSHQEFNHESIKNNVSINIDQKTDIFYRDGNQCELVDVNIEYPSDMINFINEKYKYLIK
jgi:beta-1,4-mannosyl-glycoprotein beta-1,4-N-acetylglucosaminyltransferase